MLLHNVSNTRAHHPHPSTHTHGTHTHTHTNTGQALLVAPLQFTALVINSTSVSLSWEAPLSQTTNELLSYMVTFVHPDGRLITEHVGGGVTSTVISDLTPGVSYRFQLAAVYSHDTSPTTSSEIILPGGLTSECAGGLTSECAGGLISECAGGLTSECAGGLTSECAGGLTSECAGGLTSECAGGLTSECAGGLTSECAIPCWTITSDVQNCLGS